MAGHIIKKITCCIVLVSIPYLISCTVAEPYFLVLRGNYQFSGGDNQGALVDYLHAKRQPAYYPWVYYNLGNLYWTLGERQSALRMWEIAENTSDADIQFAVNFNRGVLYYEQGSYDRAYTEFKHALIFVPGNIDAKINLELSLGKLQAGSQLSQGTPQGDNEMESTRIIEYVRRKEQREWVQKKEDIEIAPEPSQDW